MSHPGYESFKKGGPVPDTEASESRGMPDQETMDKAWAKLLAKWAEGAWAEKDGIAVPQNLVGAGYDVHMSEAQCAYAPLATPADAPLPSDASERKHVPLHSGLVKYFPDALIAIADLSWRGNEQHNPGQPLHWSREKSSDHEDCLMRHHFEAGTFDKDGVRHSTKRAWRALAALQLEIEASR